MTTHSEYVTQFGELFYEQTKLLIDRNQNKITNFEVLNNQDADLIQVNLNNKSHAVAKNKNTNKIIHKLLLLRKYWIMLIFVKKPPLNFMAKIICLKKYTFLIK